MIALLIVLCACQWLAWGLAGAVLCLRYTRHRAGASPCEIEDLVAFALTVIAGPVGLLAAGALWLTCLPRAWFKVPLRWLDALAAGPGKEGEP